MSTRIALWRYDFWRWRTTGLWQSLAHKLPRRIAYFAYIRVMAHAWADAGNKHPDELTVQETCERWEQTR